VRRLLYQRGPLRLDGDADVSEPVPIIAPIRTIQPSRLRGFTFLRWNRQPFNLPVPDVLSPGFGVLWDDITVVPNPTVQHGPLEMGIDSAWDEPRVEPIVSWDEPEVRPL